MPDKPESFLIADCGSVNTKVGLVDLVGGEYRFVGVGVTPTTTESPNADVLVGVRRVAEQLQARVNRRLLTEDGRLITPELPTGQGVDAFAAATSAPLPIRVAIVGLSRAVSLASATRAINSTYATVEATLALDETGSRWLGATVVTRDGEDLRPGDGDAEGSDQKRTEPLADPAALAAEKLAQANPEVIVLVGGIDGGATTALYELANLVAVISAGRDTSARPVVVFAGNRQARPEIAARVGQVAPLRVVDNVHPALDRENPRPLQHELEALYEERKIGNLPGVKGLAEWTQAPVLPAARAFENVVRFLSRRHNLNVVGVDIGGSATTLVNAQGEAFRRVVRADLGTGFGLESLVAQAGVDRLVSWLPFETSPEEALAYYLNHAVHPASIPATREEARLMQAAVREAIALTARSSGIEVKGAELILLSGAALSRNTSWGSVALMALDALQPQGILTLAVDALNLAPSFGALASISAAAAAGVLERDGFTTLGTVIAPISNNREGQIDLRVQVQPTGSGAMSLEVEHGSLEVIPLAPGQRASLEVETVGSALLPSAPKGVYKAEVEGGTIGVIIDARGRPIALPSDADKCRTKVQEWLWDIGG
ncbi:MAG: glutamate mutase L [Chloroflexi bacterium]|nr:glutamate mutase L [Chloroflexota bacterium]